MRRSLYLAAAIIVVFAPTVRAADVAWDMVNSTSQGLTDYTNFAPPFTSPGDGFGKFQVNVSLSIPFAMLDDSAAVFPADVLGVIDSNSDFDEFFGITDTNNADTSGANVSAAWTFDISSGEVSQLCIDMAAMGDFEELPAPPGDFYAVGYQVDGGAAVTETFAFTVGSGTTITYTLASSTQVQYGDPLQVGGTNLTNVFDTFCTAIPDGNTIIVTVVTNTDGGSETLILRNLVIKGSEPTIFTDDFEGGTTGTWSNTVP